MTRIHLPPKPGTTVRARNPDAGDSFAVVVESRGTHIRPVLSVIVPIYEPNLPAFSRWCRSIAGQAGLNDIEFVLVDDGSPTLGGYVGRRAKELAAKLPNMQFLVQKHGNAGRARNAGIASARGDWIGFADCDDEYAHPGVLHEFKNLLARLPAWIDGAVTVPNHAGAASTDEAKAELVPGLYWTPWSCAYRREFILSAGIGFDNTVCANDVGFSLRAFAKARGVQVLPHGFGYTYTPTRRLSTPALRAAHFKDLLRVKAGAAAAAKEGSELRKAVDARLDTWLTHEALRCIASPSVNETLAAEIAGLMDGNLPRQDPRDDLLVCMTTHAKRAPYISRTVLADVLQARRAGARLCISCDAAAADALPDVVREYAARGGLDLFVSEKDYGSNMKYMEPMRRRPHATIIAVDDDTIYPESTFKTLVRFHGQLPDAVLCRNYRYLPVDERGNMGKHVRGNEWKRFCTQVDAPELVENGFQMHCGAVLYPAGCLDVSDASVREAEARAPHDDDVFANILTRRAGRKLYIVPEKTFIPRDGWLDRSVDALSQSALWRTTEERTTKVLKDFEAELLSPPARA